jgi:hypothetical protein
MKKIIFFSLVFIMAIVLSGCATNENFVKQYNGWVGKNINDYIAQSGYPDNSYDMSSGNKVYVYNKNSSYIYPRHTIGFGYFGRRGRYIGGFYPGMGGYDEIVQTCTIYLEVDKKGTIIKWGSKGNSCVADEPKNGDQK